MAELLKMKAAKKHTVYKNADGKRLPGVTTITGTLAKPFLPKWAVSVERKGYVYEEYLDYLAKIGSCAHEMCAAYLEEREPEISEYTSEMIDFASNGAIKFIEWCQGHDIELIASEKQLVSEKFQYGGTMDVYWKCDGKLEVADIKSSDSGIYLENMIQCSAYAQAARENGFKVEQIRVVRIGKRDDDTASTVVASAEDEDGLFDMFLRLRENYEAAKILKKRVGVK